MREILFKAKRWSDGKWVYGDLNQLQDSTIIHWYNNGCRVADEVDPSTVCQYTGLKDKNGKRIFEGDNVYDPHENSIYTVEWNENNAIFQMAHDWRRRSVETAYYCEIIGNIHDGEGGQHEGAEHD
ncbi:YopX family protein [Dysosmobacter welbionis]